MNNVVRGIWLGMVLVLLLLIYLLSRAAGCMVPDPPEVITTVLPEIDVKPPLFPRQSVVVPSPQGLQRVRVESPGTVEAVISVPPSDSATVLLVDRVDAGWFPGFTGKPLVRIRKLGETGGKPVVVYQRQPLLAFELKPLLGASWQGTLQPQVGVQVVRVWGFHFGPSLALDVEEGIQPDLLISVELLERLHLGTGVLDALERKPSITLSYAFR